MDTLGYGGDGMKRLMDILGASVGLVLFSPVLMVLVVLIRRDMGRPVLFRQARPGLHGKPFEMLKFRSMRDGVESDAARLTPLGARLRSTSLDELPGLWNVLKGDMSLVGPRPLLMEYLPLYSHEQARRHDMRPGLTGWAQVNGRNAIGWDEKFVLDVWYVDHRTFWLDCRIIAMTILKVVRRDGIRGADEATMSKFTGSGTPPCPGPEA